MRHIKLTKGYVTMVDDEDFELLNRFKWYSDVKPNGVYPSRKISTDGFSTSIRMHYYIIDVPEGCVVDHIDRNPLNNQKNNLRVASHSQNSRNRTKSKSKTTSKYLGVYWDKVNSVWKSQLRIKGMRINGGQYHNEEEAALAYNKYAKIYYGEFANLNIVKEPTKGHSENIIEPCITLSEN